MRILVPQIAFRFSPHAPTPIATHCDIAAKMMMKLEVHATAALLLAALVAVGAANPACDTATLVDTFGQLPTFLTHNCSAVNADEQCTVSCNASQLFAGAPTHLTCNSATSLFVGSLPTCQEKRPRIQIHDASMRIGVYDDAVVEVAYLANDNQPNDRSGRLLSEVEIEDTIAEALGASEGVGAIAAAVSKNVASAGDAKVAIQDVVDANSPTADTLRDYLIGKDSSISTRIGGVEDDIADNVKPNVTNLYTKLNRCLKTCPAGKFVSQFCQDLAENQCSECPDGFYSSGDNLDAECMPCVCPRGQYVKNCSKDSAPECVDTPMVVQGCGQCGANQWKIEGPHTITYADDGCWNGTENHNTRVYSGDVSGQDNFVLTARSSVAFVAGSYDFSCHADDFCSIRVKKIHVSNAEWEEIIPMNQPTCCHPRHARATLDTADYEVEYRAEEDIGEFYFTFYIVPT